MGLHPENSYCWESLFWDLTPNPPPETLTLLPGPHFRRGLSEGPGTSFLLPNPKPKCAPHPPPNRLPGTGSPALLAHPLSLIANISHLFQPSPPGVYAGLPNLLWVKLVSDGLSHYLHLLPTLPGPRAWSGLAGWEEGLLPFPVHSLQGPQASWHQDFPDIQPNSVFPGTIPGVPPLSSALYTPFLTRPLNRSRECVCCLSLHPSPCSDYSWKRQLTSLGLR